MTDVSATIQAVERGTATQLEPVRKSVMVRASQTTAFRIFAEEMDTWWPRTHHIGASPMKRVVVERRSGGRVYTNQEDHTICQWGTVLAWEPPNRFLMAWQISPEWKFEPELARCSEVEVRFSHAAHGQTLVELEHRGLQKHGGACAQMRGEVDSEGGWGTLLNLFAAKVETNA